MLVSVIIPIYNSEEHIRECIQSVINQTYKNLEIILVNDGSTDNSLDICEEYAIQDKRIKIISTSNYGVSHARNIGIEESNGQYISFIDSDDIIHNDFFEVLIKGFEKDRKIDLSCVGVCEGNIKNNEDNEEKIINNDKHYYLIKMLKGYLPNKLYKKEIIDKFHMRLNENISMCEDLLFNFEYLDYCNFISYNSEKLYIYRNSTNGLSKSLTKKWFDILYVYNNMFLNKDKHNKITQEYIILHFMYSLCEAKMRCELMKIDFNNILIKNKINKNKIFKEYYKKIIFSDNITIKEKIRLVIFFRLEKIAKKIKFKRGKYVV